MSAASESNAQQGEDIRALFLFLDQTTPIRVECSWCSGVISPGREPVSHGICPACAKEYFGFSEGDPQPALNAGGAHAR